MDLEVTRSALAVMREAAARAHPHEACGLLLGEGARIDVATVAANVAAEPARAFEIDPVTLIAAHKAARAGGPQVVGYWHSHPAGPAEPSATDRAQAAREGRVWAIVAGGTIGWWRDAAEGFVALSTRALDG